MSAAANAAGYLYRMNLIQRVSNYPGAGRVVDVGASKNTAPAARTVEKPAP